MPVPASESAEELRTPEVFSQNELYGRYDGGKMDEMLDSFLIAASTGADSPRGSKMGANSSLKFDPEAKNDYNLDAKESTLSSALNYDDLLDAQLSLFEELPLSSQEMNDLYSSATLNDISDDYERIGMPVEEVNDSATPGELLSDNSSAVQFGAVDRFSQFFVDNVNQAQGTGTTAVATSAFEDTKPDIVQNALRQANMVPEGNSFSPDELANATFVMVRGDHGDAALGHFMTLDPSAIFHITNDVNNVSKDVIVNDSPLLKPIDASVATIPLTVQAVEPEESTSGTPNLATSVVQSAASTAGGSAVATNAQEKSSNCRKRKAPSTIVDDDDWKADDDATLDYKEKRRRNNLAVRKSRAAAKEKQKTTEEENERLRQENEKKSREIEILQSQVKIYRELFERSGFTLPRK